MSRLTKPDDVINSMFEVFHQLISKELLQCSEPFSLLADVAVVTAGIEHRIYTESGPTFGGTACCYAERRFRDGNIMVKVELRHAGSRLLSLEFYEGGIAGISEEPALV